MGKGLEVEGLKVGEEREPRRRGGRQGGSRKSLCLTGLVEDGGCTARD
jgi:hypothetical protein